jgi:hypothetical protein
MFRVPGKAADNLTCPGIQQQFVRVETVPCIGRVRAVYAKTVHQSRTGSCQETVEHTMGGTDKFKPVQFSAALGIEQAQFHAMGMVRENRKVHAPVTDMRTHGFATTIWQLDNAAVKFGFLHAEKGGLRPDGKIAPRNCGTQPIKKWLKMVNEYVVLLQTKSLDRILPANGCRLGLRYAVFQCRMTTGRKGILAKKSMPIVQVDVTRRRLSLRFPTRDKSVPIGRGAEV